MIDRKQVDEAMARLNVEFPEDCRTIAAAIEAHHGVKLTQIEAEAFWRWRSEQWSAGWLMLGEAPQDEINKWFMSFCDDARWPE